MHREARLVRFRLGAVEAVEHEKRIKRFRCWMSQHAHKIHTCAVKCLLTSDLFFYGSIHNNILQSILIVHSGSSYCDCTHCLSSCQRFSASSAHSVVQRKTSQPVGDKLADQPRHQKSRQRNRTRIQKIWQTSRRYLPRFRRKMSHWATPFQTAHIQTRYARFSLHAAVFCYNREYLKKHEKEYTSMRPTILYITAGASSPWRTTTMARRSAYMYTTFNDPPVVV